MTVNEKIHYKGRYLGFKERDDWEYAYRTNATGVVVLIPVTDTGDLILVEQFRTPVRSRVIELPAGLVGDNGDNDESFHVAAQRELFEETGYRAAGLKKLLTCPSTPGMSDEMINIYLATGLEKIGPGGGDHNEDIVVHRVPLTDAPEWLLARQAEGLLVDPKIYAGLFWAGLQS